MPINIRVSDELNDYVGFVKQAQNPDDPKQLEDMFVPDVL
jgi:hypothetical protein